MCFNTLGRSCCVIEFIFCESYIVVFVFWCLLFIAGFILSVVINGFLMCFFVNNLYGFNLYVTFTVFLAFIS